MQAGAGFEVREITTEDIPFLTPIGKGQLGVDYISDADFEEAISDPGQFCLTPVVDGVPSGFAICREFGPESEPEELALPDSGYRDWVRSRRRIGLVDSVALSPSVGGRGIGKALYMEALEIFRDNGCESIVIFTDNDCGYSFYDNMGCSRVADTKVELDKELLHMMTYNLRLSYDNV